VDNRVLLSLYPLADECNGLPDSLSIGTHPWVFGHSDLVPSNRISDVVQPKTLASTQLRNSDQVDEQKSLGAIDERSYRIVQCFWRRRGEAVDSSNKARGELSPYHMIRAGNRHMPNAGVADEEPIREVALLVDDPQYRVEEWARRRSERARASLMSQNEGASKRLVLGY
jgi:hypothetical protein